MNSNISSTSNDSLSCILQQTHNENLFKNLRKNTSADEVTSLDNIDINLTEYLNNEFINLGYNSIQSGNSTKKNYNLLFENAIDITSRYNRQIQGFNRSQEQNYKLDHENEMLLKRQQSLKDAIENSNRELANIQEKFRQAQSKSSLLAKTVKDLTDENKKIQNTLEQRDKQYKHERKKLEKENNRIKERVQVLTTGKIKDLPNIDLTSSIYRGTNGSRATWNSDGSKKQIELYSELIKDYDRKNKELIIENTEIKSFLADTYLNLVKSLNNDQKSTLNSSTLELDDDEILSEDITRYSFDRIFSKLNKEFKIKFDLVKEKSEKFSRSIHSNNSIENLNSNINNLTISSINSYSTKNHDTVTGDEELMNTTFTIEETSKNQNNTRISISNNQRANSYFPDKNISSSTSSSSASPPSMSLLTEHLEKINNSSRNKDKPRDFNMPENKFNNFMQSENKNQNEENLKKSSCIGESTIIKNELYTLNEERRKLAMEKKYFYDRKLKLEEESNSCRKIAYELDKEKKEFQDEQENYYQSKLFSTFNDQSHISKNQ